MRLTVVSILVLALAACQTTPEVRDTSRPETIGATVAALTTQATLLPSVLRNRWAVEYAAQVTQLLPIAPRKLFCTSNLCWPENQIPPSAGRARPEFADEADYYGTGLASPLFHARLVDLVAEGQLAKQAGKRVLDLYAESIGPLKLLAASGFYAVGVSQSPRLRALYAQSGDQGPVSLPGRDVSGHVAFLSGDFPSDPAVRAKVGQGYEFVLVKNVLKRGTVRPTSEVPPEQVFGLGMPDADYLRSLRELLRPGGRLLVYNLCKTPNPMYYDPQTDCRSPWSQAEWQTAGFVVTDFERNDTEMARKFAEALGFDRAPVAIPNADLYAVYTLVLKP